VDVHRGYTITVEFDDELIAARERAFSELLADVERLKLELADAPAASVSCTRRQYVAVLSDSDLSDVGAAVMAAAAGLDGLAIDDPHEIGGSCRARLQGFIEQLKQLVRAAREVAIFTPPTDLTDMRQLQLDFAAKALAFGEQLLNALMAPTVEDFERVVGGRLNFTATAFEELAGILAAHDWDDDGPEERVAQVFALEGPWFDASGFPDDAQIGFEVGDSRAPVRRLGAASATYFQHLLDVPPEEVGPVSLTLIPSARQLALLERPLPAHRVAIGLRRQLDAAWARDQALTKTVLADTGEAEQLVYEARRRIALHLRRLSAGPVDLEEIAAGLMLTHKRLAEASRVYAVQILRLEAIAEAGADDPEVAELLLGRLESRLTGIADPALQDFVTSIVVALRNAEAHEDYRFDTETAEVVSLVQPELRTGLDELDDRVEALAGALEAAVAAFVCFQLDTEAWVDPPQWVATGQAPALTEAWTVAVLAAFGHHATAVRLDTGESRVEIDIAPPPEGLSADALLTAAVAAGNLVTPDTTICVRDASDGREVVTLDAAAARQFSAAEQPFRDLALWHVVVAARLAQGQSRDQAASDALAVMILLIENNDCGDLVEAVGRRDARPFRHLRRRLTYVRKFAAEFSDCFPKTDDPIHTLVRAEQVTTLASRWDSRALDRLAAALVRLAAWREQHASQSPTYGRFLD
jgi:hypothetical protein